MKRTFFVSRGLFSPAALCIALWAAPAVAALLLAGCASGPAIHLAGGDRTVVESALADRTWLLVGFSRNGVLIPLEPGHGTDACLVLRADGKLEGSTGINAFSGTWKLGAKRTGGRPDGASYAASISVGGMTRKAAPNGTAARFESDLLDYLARARTLKTEKDSFLLLDGQKEVLLRYLRADGVSR